jgi:hypothetical protein
MIRAMRAVGLVIVLCAPAFLFAAENAAAQVDVTGIDKLAKEGLNAIDWVAGPLSRATPPGARSDILGIKETLEDEAEEGAAGNPEACKLGIQLCDLLLATLADRETTIAKTEANDKADLDASAREFFDESVDKGWTERASRIRGQAEDLYEQFRKAARPSLAGLHGEGEETGGAQVFSKPPPAAVTGREKSVVFSAGGGGPGDFQIISATYGADKKKMDVGNVVRRFVANNELHMAETDWHFGSDPAPGKRKSLTIVYYANGAERTYKSDHAEEVVLPSADAN